MVRDRLSSILRRGLLSGPQSDFSHIFLKASTSRDGLGGKEKSLISSYRPGRQGEEKVFEMAPQEEVQVEASFEKELMISQGRPYFATTWSHDDAQWLRRHGFETPSPRP